MPNPMVMSLYKSADMENEMTISLGPVDGFKCIWGQFGVLFEAKLFYIFLIMIFIDLIQNGGRV